MTYPHNSYQYPYGNPYSYTQQRLAQIEQANPHLINQQFAQQPQQVQQQTPINQVITINSEKDIQSYAPDLTGAKRVFELKDDEDRMLVQQFKIQTGKLETEEYKKVKIEPEKKAESQMQENPLFVSAIQSFVEKFENLQNEIKEIKEAVLDVKKSQFGRDSESNNAVQAGDAPNNGAGEVSAKSKRSNATS